MQSASMTTADRLHRLFQSMVSQRSEIERLYNDVDKYIMDRDGDVSTVTTQAGSKSKEVFSKIGVESNANLAAALQGWVAPAEQRWFTLQPNTEATQPVSHESQLYLERLENLIYATFSTTNFYQKSLELLTDYTAYGLGGLYIEPDPVKRIKVMAIPVRELYIQTDFDGEVNTVARRFSQTASNIANRFPKTAPSEITNNLNDPNVGQLRHVVIHMVTPNPSYEPMKNKNSLYNRPFISHYLLEANRNVVLEESYLPYNPFITPRWEVLSGEIYGRSRAMLAIPDIKTVCDIVKNFLIGMSRLTRPPMLIASESIQGASLNLNPDGITQSGKMQGNQAPNPIIPLGTNARPDIALQAVEVWKQQIKDIFMQELIQEGKQQRMSATEANIKQNLRLASLAPQHGRLNPEYLDKLIEVTMYILISQGHIDSPPNELLTSKVQYINPLAKAQKMANFNNTISFVTQAAQLAQIDPTVMETINMDSFVRHMADALDVSPTIMRSPEEVQQRIQAMQEQQQTQQALQASQSLATTLNESAKTATLLEQTASQEGGM